MALVRSKQALESPCETMARREQVRAHTAKKRALESPCETMARCEQVQAHTPKKRALESPSETIARREQIRVNTAKRRALPVAIDNAIGNFQSKAKMGPDFVCTVCHRMMYKQNVIPSNKSKYTKVTSDNTHITIKTPRIAAVYKLQSFKMCIRCHSPVEPEIAPLGRYTKKECGILQDYTLCDTTTVAELLIVDGTKK